VPLTDQKELYGIKFKNPDDSMSFYAKIVTEMGEEISCCRISVFERQQMPTIALVGIKWSAQKLTFKCSKMVLTAIIH